MSKAVEERINLIVDWLREQVENSGTKGLVVGLSGGIDSSVVAFLIKKAFPENSMGVIMPCKSNEKDKHDAIEVAEAAGLEHICVDLTTEQDDIFIKISLLIDEDISSDKVQVLLEDLRSFITNNYYECTLDIFKGLGELYISDKRFTKNIDSIKPGLTNFISEAIKFYSV